MNRMKRTIAAAVMSMGLLLSGCGSEANLGGAGSPNGGFSDAPITERRSEASNPNPAIAENEAAKSEASARKASMSVNGKAVSLNTASYGLSENGNVVFALGETEGVYVMVLFATTADFAEGTISSKDFGSVNEYSVTLASPSTGEVYSGATPDAVSDPSFTVETIADGFMNVSMSGIFSAEIGDFAFELSGGVGLSDIDTIADEITEFSNLIASAAPSASSGGGGTSLCPGCYGDLKCPQCEGDKTCHNCLSGQLDHCVSCGGSNVCQYCGGDGICPYCHGTGVV